MISDGLIITVTGMLVVFTFLALMVLVTRLMSALVLRYFPEPAEPPPAPTRAARDDDAELAVAIAVAFAHRAGTTHDTRS